MTCQHTDSVQYLMVEYIVAALGRESCFISHNEILLRRELNVKICSICQRYRISERNCSQRFPGL